MTRATDRRSVVRSQRHSLFFRNNANPCVVTGLREQTISSGQTAAARNSFPTESLPQNPILGEDGFSDANFSPATVTLLG